MRRASDIYKHTLQYGSAKPFLSTAGNPSQRTTVYTDTDQSLQQHTLGGVQTHHAECAGHAEQALCLLHVVLLLARVSVEVVATRLLVSQRVALLRA